MCNVKVWIDAELCQGNGICEMRAPDIFELAEDDIAIVKKEHPLPEEMPNVDAAVRACPMQAVLVREDEVV